MKCSGIDALSGSGIEISFERTILSVEPSAPAGEQTQYLAPGWIDLQVNGFAGVDYNNPATSHEEIARSIQALFSTGVTRFYPTVITGAPGRHAGRAAQPGRGQAEVSAKETPLRASTLKGRTSRPRTARAARIPAAGCARPTWRNSAACRTPPRA